MIDVDIENKEDVGRQWLDDIEEKMREQRGAKWARYNEQRGGD